MRGKGRWSGEKGSGGEEGERSIIVRKSQGTTLESS